MSTHTTSPTPFRRTIGLAALVLGCSGVAACADDDEAAATSGDLTAYCDAATTIDEFEGLPTEEMMQASFEAAPADIKPQMTVLKRLMDESDGDFGLVMADPAFAQNLNAVERWEADHCGPAHAEYELIEPEGDESAAAGAPVVEVNAVDYGFTGDIDQLDAGPVAISVTNEGQAAHEAMLLRLADGVTGADVVALQGDPFEEGLITDVVGFASVHAPGSTRFLNADLDQGTYVLACLIPGPDQTMHAYLGMQREITVS